VLNSLIGSLHFPLIPHSNKTHIQIPAQIGYLQPAKPHGTLAALLVGL
jgi:hypothetical protein